MNSVHSEIFSSAKRKMLKLASAMLAVMLAFILFGTETNIYASAITIAKPTMVAEKKYDSGATHPYNKQTNTIIIDWNDLANANRYHVYIKGGKYKDWTKYDTVKASTCTVTGLQRDTVYYFKVRGINGSYNGPFSNVQQMKTARMDYDYAGWQAMCRIVYHEVGQMSGSMWDKPIVYVSDCVVNRYVAAKYTNDKTWSSYYKKYNSIQDVIYKSGNFMSDARLTKDGATYNKVPERVKTALFGSLYAFSALNSIKNDYNIYYWSNSSYRKSDSRIAYSFKIPWGYFYVWRTYWG